MKKLTPKQEKFANLYVELGNASEAYRQAYDVTTSNLNTIAPKASKLLNEYNISTRVAELQKELKEQSKIDREWILEQHMEIVDWYKELKELARKKDLTPSETKRIYMLKDLIKGSDYRGSLDSITKMLGLNEPEKVHTKQTIEIIEKKRNEDT